MTENQVYKGPTFQKHWRLIDSCLFGKSQRTKTEMHREILIHKTRAAKTNFSNSLLPVCSFQVSKWKLCFHHVWTIPTVSKWGNPMQSGHMGGHGLFALTDGRGTHRKFLTFLTGRDNNPLTHSMEKCPSAQNTDPQLHYRGQNWLWSVCLWGESGVKEMGERLKKRGIQKQRERGKGRVKHQTQSLL